ncbi:MAG: L-2-amino-thiazoline-4-carboxylic acid hydrolase [Oscillospiraceae bacterium]|nr:L-2-amino-thiazoline-4-carboxylic acid hydrolase [Oscillospiraceae bacterium]
MRELDRQVFYSGLHRALVYHYKDEGERIWQEAADEYDRIVSDPRFKHHKGSMAVPAAALRRVLRAHGRNADRILQWYGGKIGVKLAGVVRKLTRIPFLEDILWKNAETLSDVMSSERKGYKRRLVSKPPVMYGVDILSCPYHEICKELGEEKAALCICKMDANFSKGFDRIKYDRNSALPEGADCCEYRLTHR